MTSVSSDEELARLVGPLPRLLLDFERFSLRWRSGQEIFDLPPKRCRIAGTLGRVVLSLAIVTWNGRPPRGG